MSGPQQHVVDQATAEGCFPQTAECICNGDSPPDPDCPGVGPHPPTIRYLPGPIVCEWCEDSGIEPGFSCATCTKCEGRGYPPRLEIVSDLGDHGFPSPHWASPTVYGVVKLGPPEALLWNVDINGPKPHNIVHRITPISPITPEADK
jgi:hypothetical protein